MKFSNLNQIPFFKNHSFEHHSTIDSTNDLAKSYLAHDSHKQHLIVADHQTAGRGQYQRPWASAPDKSLLFSFTWELENPSFPPSLTAGIALVTYLTQNSPKDKTKDLWLKWPNDLWYKNKKLAGILTEAIHSPKGSHCIVGVGVNLTPFPGGHDYSWVENLNPNFDKLTLLQGFCEAFSQLYGLDGQTLANLWKAQASIFFSKNYRITSGKHQFTGKPIDLTDSGTIMVIDENLVVQELTSASLQPLS